MVGTIVGAVMIVVLNACFPQDRAAFLTLLALGLAICAFAATLMRNFASYSAALAGYTAAIIAADTLGATGGPDGQVFMLAVTRASEICIGIVCAGVVLAGTDFGGAQRRLAALFAALAAEITGRFAGMLALAGSQTPDTRAQRRELTRRVIALDPAVDQAIGVPRANCATTSPRRQHGRCGSGSRYVKNGAGGQWWRAARIWHTSIESRWRGVTTGQDSDDRRWTTQTHYLVLGGERPRHEARSSFVPLGRIRPPCADDGKARATPRGAPVGGRIRTDKEVGLCWTVLCRHFIFTLAHSRSMIATIGFPTLAKNIAVPRGLFQPSKARCSCKRCKQALELAEGVRRTTGLRNSFALRRNKSVIDDEMGSRKDARAHSEGAGSVKWTSRRPFSGRRQSAKERMTPNGRRSTGPALR